jgi:hypothetical protein
MKIMNTIKFTIFTAVFGLASAIYSQTPGALGAIAGNSSGNQIYVNQITTGGDTTFIQNGASNRIGSFALPSNITGDNIFMEWRQIGDSNSTDFSITGANTTKLLSAFAGNNNEQRIYFNGANNNMNFKFDGNTNRLWINNDVTVYRDGGENTATDKATLASSDLQIKFAGNNNLFAYATTTGLNNYLKYDVTGNTNNGSLTQSGNGEKTFFGVVNGSSNVFNVTQQGSGSYLDLSLVGNGHNVSANQKDAGSHKATVNLTNSGGSSTVNLVQQGATAQNINITQQCATLSGCSVSVTQGGGP